MRDYQCMAPEKLTDVALESILWNKVSIALQQELKEIPDGSVQELLQKLLCVEATFKEREHHSREARRVATHQDLNIPTRPQNSGQGRGNNSGNTAGRNGTVNSATDPQQGAELSLKAVKCYNCQKRAYESKLPRAQKEELYKSYHSYARRTRVSTNGPLDLHGVCYGWDHCWCTLVLE